MANLTRYTYFGLFVLTLFVSVIGCGDDEVVDDIGPEVVATPEGIIKGTIVDLVTEQGVIDAQVILATEKKLQAATLNRKIWLQQPLI